jgi:carbon storage regulator
MLVLSRKVGEKILIGDQISVTVVRVGQGAVRIGVEAPDDLTIVREEIRRPTGVEPAKIESADSSATASSSS